MNYLGAEYRLEQVNPLLYRGKAMDFARTLLASSLKATLQDAASDYSELPEHILMYGDHLARINGRGGGYYAMTVAIGLSTLRAASSGTMPIIEEDWQAVIGRQGDLASRGGLTTIEAISAAGLREVRLVNRGYVLGHHAIAGAGINPTLFGFKGLGALHAHDLMHFASVRE